MSALLSYPEGPLSALKANCRPLATPEVGFELNVGSLRQSQGIVHVYAKISDGVLDVGVAEQDLHGPQVNHGDMVSITIESAQASMLPADPEKCFDLGFSANNHSSGLGLSVARDLARRHGGEIVLKGCPNHPSCTITELQFVAVN